MNNSTKIILILSLIGSLGIARNVYAAQFETRTQVAEVSDGDGEVNDATEAAKNVQNSHVSVMKNNVLAEASDGDGETNDDAEESQSAAKLQNQAKITAQEAIKAAESSIGSKASRVQLENENGNLVYAVVIGKQEVKVDAGNGKVLYTENSNQDNEKNEASLPKSSIQVTKSSDEK